MKDGRFAQRAQRRRAHLERPRPKHQYGPVWARFQETMCVFAGELADCVCAVSSSWPLRWRRTCVDGAKWE